MTRAALITTTINVPNNLDAWRHCLANDDVIIIAGDKKSPHDEIHALVDRLVGEHGHQAVYLEPHDQMDWAVSDTLGWNCIQRRNLALLEALKYDPKIVVTIDDDNYPTSANQIDAYVQSLMGPRSNTTVISSESGWFNVGMAYDPPITHRGYPLTQRHATQHVSRHVEPSVRLGVHASLWIGDPDVDAVERVVENSLVGEPIPHYVTLNAGTWCPFNSQATAFRREIAPTLLMWPGVGRYDDIWASYVSRTVLDRVGWLVRYGRPLVTQQRNEHDLVTDLERELLGYRWTPTLCDYLKNLKLPNAQLYHDVIEYVDEIFDALTDVKPHFIPDQTLATFDAWIDDLKLLVSEHQVSFIIDKEKS